jgi:glycosyltransferase involved in cell wall biosynthesis
VINILHTIDTTGPGGAETVFLNIINGLDTSKFQSTVAICGKGWVNDQLVKDGWRPLFLSAEGSFNIRYILQLISIIRKKKIDIIHSHLIGSNVYCSLAGWICGVPVISTFHGFVDTASTDSLLKLRFILINRGSDKIVFVSQQLKNHFINNYRINSDKCLTIYNGIDLERFQLCNSDRIRHELGLNQHHILIGSIGNIRPAKGYDHLLRAAAKIVALHPECRFIIAGEGSDALFADLLSLKSLLGLDEKVFFLGFRSDVAEILNSLDIFVLPSTSEGFSIATIEAMACHKPVIVTKSGGPEEIVNDKNGIMVHPGQVDELAKAVITLIKNDGVSDEYIQNAYDTVWDKFSKQRMIDEYMRLYCCIHT